MLGLPTETLTPHTPEHLLRQADHQNHGRVKSRGQETRKKGERSGGVFHSMTVLLPQLDWAR